MVWSHWMSTWAKVTPSLILGALWWAWVTLWPTGKHLRSLSWRFRVWNTSKVRTLRSWAANLLLMTCRARRPCLTFKMCPHGLFIAMVPWRPTTGLAHSSPLLFIFSASTFSSFLLTLLTLELCIEVPGGGNQGPVGSNQKTRDGYFFLKWCSGSLSPGKEECSLSSLLPLVPSPAINPA